MLRSLFNPRKDYIEFRHGFGCYSLVGRDGHKQDIVLAPYCAEEHTLIHEVFFQSLLNNFYLSFKILHALGLLHEHQRPDRDQYIEINMKAASQIGIFDQLRKACFLKQKLLL